MAEVGRIGAGRDVCGQGCGRQALERPGTSVLAEAWAGPEKLEEVALLIEKLGAVGKGRVERDLIGTRVHVGRREERRQKPGYGYIVHGVDGGHVAYPMGIAEDPVDGLVEDFAVQSKEQAARLPPAG